MAKHIHIYLPARTQDANWEESKHPRKEDGKFGTGASSGDPVPPLTPKGAGEFLDRWFTSHKDIDSAEVESILRSHPEWAHKGTVRRLIEVPVSAHKDFAEFEGAELDEIDSDAVEEYISKHEKSGFVSGSQTEAGTKAFENLGSLDRENYIFEMSYEVGHGLDLTKMAEYASERSDRIQQIIEAEEVLFKPNDGKYVSKRVPY